MRSVILPETFPDGIRPAAAPMLTSGHVANYALTYDTDAGVRSWAQREHMELPPALARAVDSRVTEFVAGRYCAREALRALGLAPPPVPAMREDRTPDWPPGIVGAITHAGGLAWAAVARDDACHGLGIDTECVASAAVIRDIESRVMDRAERRLLVRELEPKLGARAAVTLLFSAKESVYKSISRWCERVPEFSEVQLLAVDCGSAVLRFRLRMPRAATWPRHDAVDVRFEARLNRIRTAAEW